MALSLHRPSVSAHPLRLALLPGVGAHIEAVVRAYFPPPHDVRTGAEGQGEDAVLMWWDGQGAPQRIHAERGIPLVALCTAGPEVMAAALEAGADVALALPVTPTLLRAVCTAHARALGLQSSARSPEVMPKSAAEVALPFTLDLRARTLAVGRQPVHLTLREFDLLAYLAHHAGACCTRDDLLAEVWGIDFETGTNTVDVFIYSLRQKLRTAGLTGLIQTVRGVGYRLAVS